MKLLGTLAHKYGYIVHPLLFAAFPLLSFYGANAAELRSSDFQFMSFLIFNLIVGAASWLLALLLTRNRQKASILTLVFLLVFFALGRLHDSMQNFVINTPVVPIGPTKILLAASLLLIAAAWLGLRRVSQERAKKINSTLTLMGGVLIISTLFSIVPNLSGGSKTAQQQAGPQTNENPGTETRERPDVYYILLDGYARADYLKNNFNHDNSSFLASLRGKGFFVADKANTNYAHTHFSVPSTFNTEYLNYLADEMGEESTDRSPLKELTQNSEVVREFKSMGYKYATIGTQWSWAQSSPLADLDIKAKNNADSKILNIELSEFALVYMQTTALKPWISTNIRDNLVDKILGAFERTEEVSKIPEPTISFTHILSPHPPYLFDRNGIIPGLNELEILNEGFSKRDKFKEQTIYVNKLTLDLIDKILENSDKPPIIIIASDHGPASGLGRSDFKQTDPGKFNKEGIGERMGILSAYYFPDQKYDKLYENISPVNSFRAILSQYFGKEMKLLPDRNYFSNNKANEYRMFDVTDLVNEKTSP